MVTTLPTLVLVAQFKTENLVCYLFVEIMRWEFRQQNLKKDKKWFQLNSVWPDWAIFEKWPTYLATFLGFAVETAIFLAKLIWILFGQLLKKIGLLSNLTSGHTCWLKSRFVRFSGWRGLGGSGLRWAYHRGWDGYSRGGLRSGPWCRQTWTIRWRRGPRAGGVRINSLGLYVLTSLARFS